MDEKKGKLITIDGVDGSGKTTQIAKLCDRLENEGYKVKRLKYPRYDNPSSSLVKMYLGGEFGDNAKEISPYIASTFYAADRYASYKQDYESIYKNGGVIIADRYTTANMIHQAGKISDSNEKEKFLDWLWNFEFELYGIPVPDLVFFLEIPSEYSEQIISNRNKKQRPAVENDIHEKDSTHLKDSYNNALKLVEKYKWTKINCIKNNQLRTIEDIHEEIYSIVVNKINE